MKSCIGIVAGKSGGHLLPGLVKARQELLKDPTSSILFFSTQGILEETILKTSPTITLMPLSLNPVPYQQWHQFPRWILQVIRCFWSSFKCLRSAQPNKIISMGGLISVPVCLAAFLLKIPIELYELNAIPGTATKWLSPLANTVYICFAEAQEYLKKQCVIAQYPLRFYTPALEHSVDHAALGFEPQRITLLILGGSQGSLFLNTLIQRWVPTLKDVHGLQVIHQTGNNDPLFWQQWYKKHAIPALVFDYYDHIEQYYHSADIILCRSGAGTLFEAAFFQKPCITIPLECHTTSHQVNNAYAMARRFPAYIHVLRQNMLSETLEPLQWIFNEFVSIKAKIRAHNTK